MDQNVFKKVVLVLCFFILTTGCLRQNTPAKSQTLVYTPTTAPAIPTRIPTIETDLPIPSAPTPTAQPEAFAGRLLFADQSAVYLSDPLGKQVHSTNTPFKHLISITISPDGKQLAYFDESKLALQDLDTGNITYPHTPFMSNPDYSLVWAPDGSEVIFSCAADNLPYVSICAFNLQTESLRTILDARTLGINDLNTWVRFKSIDKDGSKIAFVIDPIPQFGTPDESSIAILDTMTGSITTIFDSHSQSDISDITGVAIAPDAKAVLFAAKTQGKNQIFQINTDGTELKQITKSDLDVLSPTWGPNGKYFYASVYNPNTLEVQLTLYDLGGEIINTLARKDVQLWGWFRQ